MKYSIHNTQAEAESENERLEGLLGIPNETTTTYAIPEEHDGKWLIRVKEEGTWKCDQHFSASELVDHDSSWAKPQEEPV